MTAFCVVERIFSINQELKRLHDRLTALQGMVSISAPAADPMKTSSSHSQKDKIGDYIAARMEIYDEIQRLAKVKKCAAWIVDKYISTDGIRSAVKLYYIDGMTTYQIADKLGVSQPTVSRYKRKGASILQGITI